MKIAVLLIATAFAVSGCQKEVPAEPRSQEFFMTHDQERAAVIKACKTGVGDHNYQPQVECGDAVLAQSRVDRAATIKRRLGN